MLPNFQRDSVFRGKRPRRCAQGDPGGSRKTSHTHCVNVKNAGRVLGRIGVCYRLMTPDANGRTAVCLDWHTTEAADVITRRISIPRTPVLSIDPNCWTCCNTTKISDLVYLAQVQQKHRPEKRKRISLAGNWNRHAPQTRRLARDRPNEKPRPWHFRHGGGPLRRHRVPSPLRCFLHVFPLSPPPGCRCVPQRTDRMLR